ncbi:lipase 1-like isoform X2 [Prorops nasuta]|uniref:lipase 1-like isoform X2 n=1 Tax=Prorops nasuta TaxID=863751 RepID=UPI0034CF88B2
MRSLFFVISIALFKSGIAVINIQDFLFPKNPEVKRVRSFDDPNKLYDDSGILDFIGLVTKHGYPAEEHNITTKDGYNIVLHRIPGSPVATNTLPKRIVYIQHGYLLADAGYDVWFGNVRGNSYCRSHKTLKPTDREFWQFSYEEIGLYDVASMIDYILKVTGKRNLLYIGHSMGTTAMYVLLSSKPEYNKKASLVVGLAPVAYFRHNRSPLLRYLVNKGPEIEELFEKNHIYDAGALTNNNAKIARTLCKDRSITQPFCVSFIFMFAGIDVPQLNTTLLPYMLSYYPDGVSVRTLGHYMQNIATGTFAPYDEGQKRKFARQRQKKSTEYDLKRITAPQALVYAANDALVNAEDVADLRKRLPNVVIYEEIPYKLFTHMDYLWAIDAKALLYDRVIDILRQF